MSGTPDSLLIIKPGSFGDIIHALPCAAALHRHRPGIRLTWLVDERWLPLLAGNPHLAGTIVFPRQRFRGLSGKIASLPWAFGLRRHRPGTVLDLQGLLRSGLMARLSGARRIIGLDDAREGARFFHTETVTTVPAEHAVLRYLRGMANLGCPQPARPEFWLPPGEEPSGLAPASPYILLHPFARGAGKSLTPGQVHTLCRMLAPRRVLVAGQGTLPETPDNAVNVLNRTTIAEMIWLIRRADFVVSVDSGPMHIAAAAGVPLLAIHTWSDPRRVGPFNPEAWIWQGGTIRPQDLGAGVLPGAREPGDSDLAAMADFVASR